MNFLISPSNNRCKHKSFIQMDKQSNDQRQHTRPEDQKNAKDFPELDPSIVEINSRMAAKLMGVTPSTLRNYVWLMRMPVAERRRNFYQDPPAKMPKPKTRRGRLIWPAKTFMEWLPIWRQMKQTNAQ